MTVLRPGVLDDLDVAKGAGSEAVLQSAIRKAALRFVPLLTIAYLFNYLERTSLGFAALTMNQQLGLTAGQFGLAAGVFFLGYSTFEIPSNLMLYRFGARRWLARIMISWGLVSAATAFVVGPNSFYAARLLLRIAEAGFFPGVVSGAVSDADAGVVPDRDSRFRAGRRPRLRDAAADGRNLGARGLAMAVHSGHRGVHPPPRS